jgi:hypothetical protein
MSVAANDLRPCSSAPLIVIDSAPASIARVGVTSTFERVRPHHDRTT